MKNNHGKGKTAAFALAAIFVLSGCSSERTDEYTFANAGFERGTLDGWTVEGNAFSDRCVYIQSKDEQGNAFYKKGEFFLYGGKEDGIFRGTLTSEPFKLEETSRKIRNCNRLFSISAFVIHFLPCVISKISVTRNSAHSRSVNCNITFTSPLNFRLP